MRERFTERSGPRIRYLDSAPVDQVGAPILLSPGFTDYADEYIEVLEFLSPRRVLVVEVRGRGGSEAPESGYAAADHAADLRAVVDEEGIERFHLMTFSRGTTWGLDLALSDPSRVLSVAIGDYWAREHAIAVEMAEQLIAGRFRGVPMAERIPPRVVRSLFDESRDRDLLDDLAATGLAVMVATGTEQGCILDDAAIAEYESRLPGVEIVTIDGASHDLFRPAGFAYPQAVDEFIARVERGDG